MTSSKPSTRQPHSPKLPRSVYGRRVANGAFLAVALFVTGVPIRSIVKDLYDAPPPHSEQHFSQAERHWCARRISGLKADLASHAPNELQRRSHVTYSMARWTAWLEAWDTRVQDVAERCETRGGDPVKTAMAKLNTLRTTYASGMEQLLRARTDLSADFERAADAIGRTH